MKLSEDLLLEGSGIDDQNLEKNEKYYKKFDFFYRRTAFRTMTEYYKGLFKPYLDKWRESEKTYAPS